MDPVTHGITGALIGKGFFAKRHARVAIFAATLGAVFPDVDVFTDIFSRDPLAIARYHRGFTHSFLGLPIFAIALAGLTRLSLSAYAKFLQREKADSPSFAALFLIYAVAIASHIFLDGLTSFGTRLWNPVSKDRVAWDALFIIDFVFTALVLLPQTAAWVYQERDGWTSRAGAMWGFFSVLALGVWSLARMAGFPFSLWAVIAASAICAAIFSPPGRSHWSVRIGRAAWCRIGFFVACAYILLCGIAHHAAMARVRAFAASHQIVAQKIGALPMPPSFLDWSGLILTSGGVYGSDFSLLDSGAPEFHFLANSAANRFTEEAARLEAVRTFLWFARFPVMRFVTRGGRNIVEYGDLRFFNRSEQAPMPFTFSVVFDSQGNVLHYGWVRGPRLPHPGGGSAPLEPSR